MNTITTISKRKFGYLRFICNIQKFIQIRNETSLYTVTNNDQLELYPIELLQRQRNKITSLAWNGFSARCFMNIESSTLKEVTEMTNEELDSTLLYLLSIKNDKQILTLITECCNYRRQIKGETLKNIIKHYSSSGRPEMVIHLQNFAAKVDPNTYKRNGEYCHYLAIAQCKKGNSEKGLSILRDLYKNNVAMRSFYRIIFRELIHDTVLYRSEASLVIFKRFVLEFSENWNENYPLVCLWHICWSSSWFSDQMFANELLEASKMLQNIVKDKATAFSISILMNEFNDDAVMRLLQILLSYKMMTEYAKVLQVLFNYKLKNKDIRGCTEIIRNCETLGIQLPSNQHGRYIKMVIQTNQQSDGKSATTRPNFKLKF